MFDVDTEAGTVRMMGVFGADFTDQDFIAALDDMGGKDVTLRLNSPGGDVITGLTMANAMRDYPGRVDVLVDALAASIATVFMMEAASITAHQNSIVMIHQAMTITAGNEREMREAAEVLDMLDSTISKVYARRAGRTPAYWLDKMRNETYFEADDAKRVGLVDSLVGEEAEIVRPAASVEPVATMEKCTVAKLAKLSADLLDGREIKPRPRLARTRALLASMQLATK